MCTAISFLSSRHYFGRTLDLEYTYDEHIVITPRHFPFRYLDLPTEASHYAIIGIATVMDGYPLYYDACNEQGLSIAGLNFVGNAVYRHWEEGMYNLAQFELIPWLLGRCRNLTEARTELKRINLLDVSFRRDLPVAKLHWMLSDRNGCIVVEPTADGLCIYDNPLGILTNNPPFPHQLESLSLYQNLTAEEPPKARFGGNPTHPPISRGTGALGLPGDWTSPSRFIRSAFVKTNATPKEDAQDSVNQFFHILGSVEQIEGCLRLGDALEYTKYTSCYDTEGGTCYCKTYGNHQITSVSLSKDSVNASTLQTYPLVKKEQFYFPKDPS